MGVKGEGEFRFVSVCPFTVCEPFFKLAWKGGGQNKYDVSELLCLYTAAFFVHKINATVSVKTEVNFP